METIERRLINLVILIFVFLSLHQIIPPEREIKLYLLLSLLGLTAALVPLVFHIDWQFHFRALASLLAGSSLALFWIDPRSQPIWSYDSIAPTLLETILLISILYLSQRLSSEIRSIIGKPYDPRQTNRDNPIKTLHDSYQQFEKELSRVRRYNRSLGLIVIEPLAPEATAKDAQSFPIHPIVSRGLLMRTIGEFLITHARNADLIAEDTLTQRIVYLCSDSGSHDIELAAERLSTLLKETLSLPVRKGFAVFPEDAVTLDQLLSVAHQQLDGIKATNSLSLHHPNLENIHEAT